jgi:hypothetical protein
MPELTNHCAECGKEIEPEAEFCEECAVKQLEPCPDCGKIICECEAGSGD